MQSRLTLETASLAEAPPTQAALHAHMASIQALCQAAALDSVPAEVAALHCHSIGALCRTCLAGEQQKHVSHPRTPEIPEIPETRNVGQGFSVSGIVLEAINHQEQSCREHNCEAAPPHRLPPSPPPAPPPAQPDPRPYSPTRSKHAFPKPQNSRGSRCHRAAKTSVRPSGSIIDHQQMKDIQLIQPQ